MNTLHLSIKGFKCYKDTAFDLNNITLLTGANSSGKSSIIQALLILHILANDPKKPVAELLNNKEYALELGEVFDILYQQEVKSATLSIDDAIISFTESSILADEQNLLALSNALPTPLFFLCAERLGPRNEIKKTDQTNRYCGCHGEYTAEIIDKNSFTDIDERHTLDGQKVKLRIALDNWIDLIFPGTNIRIKPNGDYLQPIIRSTHTSVQSKASNVGFGISYALPIIVSGLLAKEEEWLVIENPEAHLHAKAQSNMGYFLAQIATAGVRVVVETHSEHIVNGIRRFMITTKQLSPDNSTIYFLPEGEENFPLKINIDGEGNLSDFPVDFFDQSRQDLLAIINAVTK